MPSLHRYLGNPVLSFIGQVFFHSPCGDFHCGLRGFRRDAIVGLNLRTTGMEFASEMVVKPTLHGLQNRRGAHTLSRTAAPARRICEAGATAGGICAFCCCTARAVSFSSRASPSCSPARR